MQVTVVYWSTK